jgi:hypothetical protein
MSTEQLSGVSVGRIVHFVEKYIGEEHYAAIIVRVHEPSETIKPGVVDLMVFGVDNSYSQRNVRYDEAAAARTWHRPEYVK